MIERVQGVVLGRVTDVEDPENLGRIRVRYEHLKTDVESDWAHVLSPFAGAERGLYAMPAPDDVAVVGFMQGDVNAPYVLGFVWNGGSPPPSASVTERRWVSVNGHGVTLSDQEVDGIVIEDAHGNRISMTSEGIEIVSSGKLAVSAAQTADIEASATMSLKGATINLN